MSDRSTPNNAHFENSEEIEEKVNEFVISYAKETDAFTKTRMLHSFTLVYLLKSDHNIVLGSNGVLDIICEVPHLCETFLSFRGTFDSQTEYEDFLNQLTQRLECVSLCFDIIQKTLKAISVISHILPIIKVALNILLLGYQHCQDSEEIYGSLLEKVVEDLGMFFKKVENLQMVMLEKMEDLCSVKHFEAEHSFDSIICSFGNLCKVVSDLDPNVASEMWTMFFKLLSQNSCLLKNEDLNSVFIYLVSKSIESLQLNTCNLRKRVGEDDENFSSVILFLKPLSNVFSLAPDGFLELFKANILQLRTFLIALLEFVPLCFSLSINCNLKNTKEFLIHYAYDILSSLLKEKDIQDSVLNIQQIFEKVDGRTQHSKTGVLLSNICCLQFFRNSVTQEKVQSFCSITSILSLSKNETTFDLLNTRVPRCAVTRSKSTELIDLFQFTYEELTILLKTLPDSTILEMNNQVLQESSKFSDVDFLLIADVWSYRLRCCKIGFVTDLLHSTLQNYTVEDIQQKVKFDSFIKRMLRFLPPSQKKLLQQEFAFKQFLQNDDSMHRHGTPDLLSSDYSFPDVSKEKIHELISNLDNLKSNDVCQLIEKSCSVMEICTLLLRDAGCSETLQFIEMADKIFRSEVYEIQVTVLTFIKALSQKHIPENSKEFGRIVDIMAELFSLAITSKNYFISCEALGTFNIFAKCTPHVKIVHETVKRNPSLKGLIKSYIAAIPEAGFLTDEEKYSFLQQSYALFKTQSNFEIQESSKNTLKNIFTK